MTVINLRAAIFENGVPRDVPFRFSAVPVRSHAVHTVEDNTIVVLPEPVNVYFEAPYSPTAEHTVTLASTEGKAFAWRTAIWYGDVKATRYIAVPEYGPVDWDNLLSVYPGTLDATHNATAWESAMRGMIVGARLDDVDLYVIRADGSELYAGDVKGARGIAGPSNVLTVAGVETGAPGSPARVTITGESPEQALTFFIPRGADGDPNTLTIGDVVTGAAGSVAAASITGEAPEQVLNLQIPRGNNGQVTSLTAGTITTGDPGSSVVATVTGTAPNQLLNLTIPRGDVGQSGEGAPVGSVLAFAGVTPPTGWLACEGGTVATATYPELYAALGTRFGGTAAQFGLPDLRDRAVFGASDTREAGTAFGTDEVALTIGNMPSHDHGGATKLEQPSVMASNTDTTGMPTTRAAVRVGAGSGSLPKLLTGSNHRHEIKSQGSNTPFSILPPGLALSYIIRAA